MKIIDIVLIAVLCISLITDIKERKILNRVTLPAIIFSLLYYTLVSGLEGLAFSAKGFLIGLGLLFIPYALGGMGAGDVKLLAAVGALKGALFVFYAFLFTCIIGGIIALVISVKYKELKNTVIRVWLVFKWRKLELLNQNEYHHAFPYGVAIGVGTLFQLLWGGV